MANNAESSSINMDDRKIRKPLMEKKRRARINDSLESLKKILMEVDPHSVNKKNAKLEKADILEMTVSYLQNINRKSAYPQYMNSYNQYSYTRKPFNSSGGQVYYNKYEVNFSQSSSNKSKQYQGGNGGIWRPW